MAEVARLRYREGRSLAESKLSIHLNGSQIVERL